MRFILLSVLLTTFFTLTAQMNVAPGVVRYGNEWLEYDRPYLRMSVAEEGFYRITATDLALNGWSLSAENAGRWQLYHRGELLPVYLTDNALYFYGKGNDGQLDQYLFENAERDQLNPAYSIYSDTSSYFLGLAQEPITGGEQRLLPTGEANGLTAEEYIVRQATKVYHEHPVKAFIRNTNEGISIFYSHYETAEGYGSRETNDLLSFNGSTETFFSLNLPGLADIGVGSSTSIRFGLGFDQHNQTITIDGQQVGVQTGNGWGVYTAEGNFTPSSSSISGSLAGSAGARDKAILASVTVDYPAVTELDAPTGIRFRLSPDATSDDRWLSFPSASTASPLLLFNLTRGTVQREENSQNGFRITDANTTDVYYLIAENGLFQQPLVSSVTFTNHRREETQFNFLIVTSDRLRTASNGSDPVAEYAAFRRSPAGGNYQVEIVNVEELYDQYSYGVARHPLGVRNFLADVKRIHPELRYLFFIGKGREYKDLRTAEELELANGTYFVPSFGLPASDNLLSAELGSVVPGFATGRLSVINAEEVAIYLDKVQEFSSQVNLPQSLNERDWMKQVVHLGGGGTPGEQSSIRNTLTNMENSLEASSFGANVTSFYKTSSEPIEESRQEAIFNRINAGTSVVTFFGHSSSQGFDFSIDNPANYFNRNKYPLMFSLGCYSGDAFTSQRSIGERFVLLPEKGAIAFGASKGLGYISALGVFGENYYRLLGGSHYGQGIGDVLKANIEIFQNNGSFSMQILTEQFSLNGDPALRLNPQPGPDLVIDPNSVRFEPRVVPAQQDSFTVELRVVNLGRGTDEDVNLRLEQQLPNGEVRLLRNVRMPAPPYENLVSVQVPNQGFEAVGLNTLLARIDADGEVNESPSPTAELNNQLENGGRPGVPFYVVANTARPAFPPAYALHEGTDAPELIASTTNPLAREQRYFLQIDTAHQFTSLVDQTEITQPGGLIRWRPNVAWQDSTVYYWRISPDSANTEGSGLIWNESSFTYLTNNTNPGWANAHQGQINEGQLTNILSEEGRLEWRFARNFDDIRIRNKVYSALDAPSWEFNGQSFGSPWPWITRHGVQVMVIDSINGYWMQSQGAGAYNSLPHNGIRDPWSFDTQTAAGRAGLIQFIEEGIPNGAYVTLYTVQRGNDIDYGASQWLSDSLSINRTIFGALEAEGANQVRQIVNLGSVPYVFIFQKGIGPIAEELASTEQDVADAIFSIASNWQEGTWTSDRIGPATDWNDLSVDFKVAEVSSEATASLKVYGYPNFNGTPTELISEALPIRELSRFNFSLASIDAQTYPYLSVEIYQNDPVVRRVQTLESAFLHFTPTPDVAIDPSVAYSTSGDTLFQGEELLLTVGYSNISNVDMDSLLVQVNVNTEGITGNLFSQRMPPIAAGGQGQVTFNLNTETLGGATQLQLQLNPNQDQLEEVVFNNDLVRNFSFNRDEIDPLIDVYFDGTRIQNGDLVSSQPIILIEIRDENQFLLLNDTSMYQLSLRYPDGSSELLSYQDDRIEFIPATSNSDNKASVTFQPILSLDGTYELRIQARDRSNNASGRLDLIKEFEVINEQRIANVFNYPNPFTSSTQFVYTLTGNAPPAQLRIQVMTVSGRVVRDIDLAAEEQLKIGTHRTQFTWDGTDEYGDELANGVYLYRVIASDDNGAELKKHNTGTDQFFANKMGKMVILR